MGRRRRTQRRDVPHRMQRLLGATSYQILRLCADAWPPLTVSTLADRMAGPRNTTHQIRRTLELRRLLDNDGGRLEVTGLGLRWLESYPDCPIRAHERPRARQVVQALREHDGTASAVQLAEHLGLHRVSVGRWLRDMEADSGCVERAGSGPHVHWVLAFDPYRTGK